MICKRCKDEKAPVGHEMCDQCLLKSAASRMNTASTTFAKSNRRRGGRGAHRHVSESLAVEPSQVEEVRDVYKRSGMGDIEHTPDGSPIFTSANQFQQATKARGMRTGRDGYDLPDQESARRLNDKKAEALKKYSKAPYV